MEGRLAGRHGAQLVRGDVRGARAEAEGTEAAVG